MNDSEKIAKLEKEVDRLRLLVESMQNPNTISPSFAKVLDRGTIAADSKASGSENQVVNEGGSASYSVLGDPDGFDVAVINGANHYYPYYL